MPLHRHRRPDSIDNLFGGLYLAHVAALLRQGLLLAWAPHALRWRLETFGLYMPSLPESRPWWRVNVVALRALLDQLPGYMRWLYQMHILRHGGARELWRLQMHGDAAAWEAWLALADDEARSSQPSAISVTSSPVSATTVAVTDAGTKRLKADG